MEKGFAHRTGWFHHPERLALLYVILLYGVIAYHFFPWPIAAFDTDLWYHLHGGRYIVEHRALPTNSSFISFITPPRPWVDYYWLFQVLVYRLHATFGYPGLIVLRDIAYLTLITVILAYGYLTYQRDAKRSPVYLVTGFALYALFLFSRYVNVRPHIFSYLLIAVFLLIYEHYPKRAMWLPLLAILWCNLHGAEYPVMLLIGGAYLFEFFINRLRHHHETTNADRAFLIPATLSMWAVFATPHGWKLLTVPFSTGNASLYISEYHQLTSEGLSTLHFTALMPSQRTLFILLLAAACIGVVVSGWRRTLRISHLLMLIGGSILLSKGHRFTYEFALLALPVLAASGPIRASNAAMTPFGLRTVALWAALVVSPFTWLQSAFGHPPRFPMSYRNLPQGVVTFLQYLQVSGPVLNDPSRGGYLQWALHPRQKIFMDMQCPLLFTEEDLYVATNMYTHKNILGNVIAAYEPSFLSVPIENNGFTTLIQEFPEYVLVFFDDAEVLYLNQRHFPALAQRYRLTVLDPFSLFRDADHAPAYQHHREAMLNEGRRVLELYPDCLLLNQIFAFTFNQEKAFDRALPFAEAIIRAYPDSRTGYGMKGDALQGLGLFTQAVDSYRESLRRSRGRLDDVNHSLGKVYRAMGRHRKAYHYFSKAIAPFSADTTVDDLYLLGSSAVLAGRSREGTLFLKFAAQRATSSDLTYTYLKEMKGLDTRLGSLESANDGPD